MRGSCGRRCWRCEPPAIIRYMASLRDRKGSGGGGPYEDTMVSRGVLRRLVRVILALVGVVTVGTLGYMVLEGWSFLDALYMTVITLSTIGYTEVHKLNTDGEVWTIMFIVGGLATFGFVSAPLVELVFEGAIHGQFRRRRMRKEIEKLDGHQILCGYGRVGRQVADEFAKDGVEFVIIDQSPEVIEECLAKGYRAISGEASNDAVLEEAGVRRAKGLIAAVDSDADNVFVTLSARKLNPKLHIVARTSSDESAAKLGMAGADRTLSPYAVGGRRLASLATQPLVVDFLDVVTQGEQDIEFRLEEFGVPEDSAIAGHTIAELKIGEKAGAMILAIRSKEGSFDTTPSAQDRLHAGDTLIVLGTRDQITRLEQIMHDEEETEDS